MILSLEGADDSMRIPLPNLRCALFRLKKPKKNKQKRKKKERPNPKDRYTRRLLAIAPHLMRT
jgi:hypothetical protein